MIKTIIVLLNFAFKCRLVDETRAIAIEQAGMQANQLASAIDRRQHNKFYRKSHKQVSFFLKTRKRSVL